VLYGFPAGAVGLASRPSARWDTTAPKPVAPRDCLEKMAENRGPDFRFIDRLLDPRTCVELFISQPPAPEPSDARISPDIPVEENPQPSAPLPPPPPKEATMRFAVARSTYRTRTPQEVLAAVQPFIELTQREVAVRVAPVLVNEPDDLFYGLKTGQEQVVLSHVFDYLLVRSWFAGVPANGTILLSWAQPPWVMVAEPDDGGPPGTAVELVVARDSPFQTFADLRGKRLSLTAHYVDAPGAFLTSLLADAGQPTDEAFFGKVTLRRYTKDTVIDLFKDKADVACVDQGTLSALTRFYGLDVRLRSIAVSPRYNVDVLYTSANNVEEYRTEIELTQRQITTLGKDPEGQEILFLFDVAVWYNYRPGELSAAREHFDDFVKFRDETPIDLRPLLDPNAPIDRQTYNRYGQEG
jgi:ABC-type phosphate/phosphonate transport system substrate-binding protein